MSDALKPIIAKAADGALTRAEAEEAFKIIMEGDATPSQTGGFLMALRTRGETVDEYAAAAAVMRAKCLSVKAPKGAMDIVGTGGDGKSTLNISTAAAIVTAGTGVVIARRGSSSTATFTVRRVSHGVGVERVFPLHSPNVTKIDVGKSGHTRRAKLYYLRDLSGKKARLREKARR